jgi:release factor glutamine methyltransferase
MKNLKRLLKEGTELLEQCGIMEARLDAWLLLEYVLGKNRAWFLAHQDETADEKTEETYAALLDRRAQHIPLQHLTGTQEFMGLTFRVNAHVLIPRQDTEVLVEEALARLRSGMHVLDLCTGSGCIAISLDRLGPGSGQTAEKPVIDAADISAEALAVAAENVQALNADVRLIQSDLFSEITGSYDMIVSNPPYIRTDEIETLSEEVRIHEPYGALDGKADGLYFYREIIRQSSSYLADGGWLLFEIGCDQGASVSELLGKAGYEEIQIIKDLAGLDRVVLGRRRIKEEIHV